MLTLQFGTRVNEVFVHYWNISSTQNEDDEKHGLQVLNEGVPNLLIFENEFAPVVSEFAEAESLNNVRNSPEWYKYNGMNLRKHSYCGVNASSCKNYDSFDNFNEELIEDLIRKSCEPLDRLSMFQIATEIGTCFSRICEGAIDVIQDHYSKVPILSHLFECHTCVNSLLRSAVIVIEPSDYTFVYKSPENLENAIILASAIEALNFNRFSWLLPNSLNHLTINEKSFFLDPHTKPQSRIGRGIKEKVDYNFNTPSFMANYHENVCRIDKHPALIEVRTNDDSLYNYFEKRYKECLKSINFLSDYDIKQEIINIKQWIENFKEKCENH